MKRSYHFYSYHSADLAAYHGQPTKRKALLNFSFPLEGKCHEVAKGCTRARMIMLLPLLPYAGPTSADLEVLCRTSTATLIRLRWTFPYAGDRIKPQKNNHPISITRHSAAKISPSVGRRRRRRQKGCISTGRRPGCMVFPSLLLHAQIDRNVQRP